MKRKNPCEKEINHSLTQSIKSIKETTEVYKACMNVVKTEFKKNKKEYERIVAEMNSGRCGNDSDRCNDVSICNSRKTFVRY